MPSRTEIIKRDISGTPENKEEQQFNWQDYSTEIYLTATASVAFLLGTWYYSYVENYIKDLTDIYVNYIRKRKDLIAGEYFCHIKEEYIQKVKEVKVSWILFPLYFHTKRIMNDFIEKIEKE